MKLVELYEEINPTEFYHGSPYEFDKFDMTKVGTGDGLSKYGRGIYFTTDKEGAIDYARELTLGKIHGKSGLNVYTVGFTDGTSNFVKWDDEIPQWVFDGVVESFRDMDKDADADGLVYEFEMYGDMITMDSMYQYVDAVLGSDSVIEFLHDIGIDGVITKNVWVTGLIYVAYTDDIIHIRNVEKVV